MWEKEHKQEKTIPDKNKKAPKVKPDNNLYFTIQLILSAIILVAAFMLKNSNQSTFIYAKENYQEFFETDKFMENTFSYNMFAERMYNELQIRFGRLMAVINDFSGKGQADIYPDNISQEKIYIENKGKIPVNGFISSAYGIRKNPFNEKQKEFHTGMDIAAPKGSYIKAAFSGQVTAAKKSDIAGNYIRIKSGNIETMYAHNQFNLVKEGEKVIAGQVIGTVGRTGYATGPHLHFEFIVDGIRYNPVYAIEI